MELSSNNFEIAKLIVSMELTPADVLGRKHSVDKAMYTFKPFFSKELFGTYETFMRQAFGPLVKPGADPQIRSDISTDDGDRRAQTLKGWDIS